MTKIGKYSVLGASEKTCTFAFSPPPCKCLIITLIVLITKSGLLSALSFLCCEYSSLACV